jgi:N-acetyl-gamma-glutamyl-phosphate reductase
MATAAAKRARIGVLGASGYTGAELVRLLIRHPAVELAASRSASSRDQLTGPVDPFLTLELGVFRQRASSPF